MGLYDPNEPEAPTPTITGITPAGRAFAGMDTVVIQGTNFSSVLANNIVYFNAQPAVLLSASPTQLVLKAPLVTMDSIGVRIAVMGAVSFSNTYQYKLSAGAAAFGVLITGDATNSLATDAAGNIYADYSTSGVEAGILKFTSAGARSNYAPATSGVVLWTGLKMGPTGYLYAARNVRAIYRFTAGGGSSAAVWVSFGSGTYITDFDFDKDGNVWGTGNNSNIYRVDKNKVIATYPFVGNVHSVRVYNDYLYFAAKTDAGEKIWRAPITLGALGSAEIYFDFGAVYPTNVPLSITFSSDGVLYIGTDAQDGLVIVSTTKAVSAPYTAYKSLFGTGIGFLAWGSADDLYASTSNGVLLKFTIRGKTSATYFGATL
jgi:streptogramin lyase